MALGKCFIFMLHELAAPLSIVNGTPRCRGTPIGNHCSKPSLDLFFRKCTYRIYSIVSRGL